MSKQELFNYGQDIVMAFSPPVVGCLVKKGLQKGGHGHPWNPLATPLQKLYKITPITNNLLPVYGPHSSSFTLQKETVR